MILYKTTIVIWTKEDPSNREIDYLAGEAVGGCAYCSKQESVQVDPFYDADWDGNEFFDDGVAWVTLCRRTNDPKLAWLEARFNDNVSPIPHRRKGESWHAPILQVPEDYFDEAQAILGPIDDIPDDDPRWADPWSGGGVS